jgi:hypothetical protein
MQNTRRGTPYLEEGNSLDQEYSLFDALSGGARA